MKRNAIAWLVLAAALSSCATEGTTRSANVEKILGPYDSQTVSNRFPVDPNRPVRGADCTKPIEAEGANLDCGK